MEALSPAVHVQKPMTLNPFWYLERWTTQRLIQHLGETDSELAALGRDIAYIRANGGSGGLYLLMAQAEDMTEKCDAITKIIRARVPSMLDAANVEAP